MLAQEGLRVLCSDVSPGGAGALKRRTLFPCRLLDSNALSFQGSRALACDMGM